VEVVASFSQGRTAAAQCGLFTKKSVPVIFEPPCTYRHTRGQQRQNKFYQSSSPSSYFHQHSTLLITVENTNSCKKTHRRSSKKGMGSDEWVALSHICFRALFAKRIFCFAFVSGSLRPPARITVKSALKRL